MPSSFFELGKKILRSNFNLLSHPYKLTFAVTYRCNARCATCNIWQRKSEQELSLSEMERFFQENHFSWINLTGGEPTLRDDLADIIKVIQQNNPVLYFLNFTSNGLLPDRLLATAKTIRTFIKIPKYAVGVSVEGPPEVDLKIRRIAESFKLSLQSFKGLREIYKGTAYQPFISYTISPHNLGKLKETLAAIRAEVADFRLSDFHINLFHFSSHYYGNQEYQLSEDFEVGSIKEIKDYLENYRVPLNPDTWIERKYLQLLIKFLMQQKTPLPCQALRASCYIDPQGNIYPCAMFDKKLGSLKGNDFELSQLWSSDNFKETRKSIAEYKCPNCWTPCEAYQTILGNMI